MPRSTTARAAIVINTPNNPTGKVFTREELTLIAELCQRHDAVAFTDEIYEHILYDGAEHVPIASLPGHGGPDRDRRRAVQDLLGDRVARRVGHRLAAS